MKQAWEWTEQDLRVLVREQVKESVTLDYKSGNALKRNSDKCKNEISKDVSAMANSFGGAIVYGIRESGYVPEDLDGVNPSEISREWLEQVINSRIQPRIDGIRINQVQLSDPLAGLVAYVVHIPQSRRAPHQASDKKCYRRFNFESVAMELYEIWDVARRTQNADLELRVRDGWYKRTDPNRIRCQLTFQVYNPSRVTAAFAVVTLGLSRDGSAVEPEGDDWQHLGAYDRWSLWRCAFASGGSRWWSPITPGFTMVFPPLIVGFPVFETDVLKPGIIGLARLDHDGGSAVYRVQSWPEAPAGGRITVALGLDTLAEQLIKPTFRRSA